MPKFLAHIKKFIVPILKNSSKRTVAKKSDRSHEAIIARILSKVSISLCSTNEFWLTFCRFGIELKLARKRCFPYITFICTELNGLLQEMLQFCVSDPSCPRYLKCCDLISSLSNLTITNAIFF